MSLVKIRRFQQKRKLLSYDDSAAGTRSHLIGIKQGARPHRTAKCFQHYPLHRLTAEAKRSKFEAFQTSTSCIHFFRCLAEFDMLGIAFALRGLNLTFRTDRLDHCEIFSRHKQINIDIHHRVNMVKLTTTWFVGDSHLKIDRSAAL